MTGFAILSTTVPDAETATRLAEQLVTARLAACVQIVPITSVYRWDGVVESAAEQLLLCKIVEADFAAVAAAISAEHPYDVPELVVTPISAASGPYLGWLASSTAVSEDGTAARK